MYYCSHSCFQNLRQQSDLLQHGLSIRPFQVLNLSQLMILLPTLFVVQRSHTTMVFDVALTFYTICLQSAYHGVSEGASIDTSLNHSKSSLVNAWLVTGATAELNALHWDVGFNLAYFLPGIDDIVPLSFRSTSSRLFNYSLNVFITTIVSSKGTSRFTMTAPLAHSKVQLNCTDQLVERQMLYFYEFPNRKIF